MKIFSLSMIAVAILAAFSFQGPVIKAVELKPWLGNWKGSLTYLDYSTGQETKIKADIKLGPIVDGNKVAIAFTYPDEPGASSKDTLRISDDGRSVNYMNLSSKKKTTSSFVVVLETEGEDNGQKAEIRTTYSFNKNTFSNKKEVRYRGQSDFFVRNEYKLTR
ncbi:MAG TPA: hypothetical protein PKG90_03685 [Chitinophagaceae bacterium]|nr:hypothetical protein [Chitinophagaceae bacterium]